MAVPDWRRLQRDLTQLGGAGAQILDASRPAPAPPLALGVVRIGVHWDGSLPDVGRDVFDVLLTGLPVAPSPWVSVGDPESEADDVARRIRDQPAAAAIAAQIMRATLKLSFAEALTLESLSYSMLLASEGFARWRAANPPRNRRPDDGPRVSLEADDSGITIKLSRPASRNAFDARMRDELSEALAFALDHPDKPPVRLCGDGPAFSAGGDLDEFGKATDPGFAHLIRTLRSPARMVQALGERASAQLHGACVGAGIEVPAAAAWVTARAGAFFRLPEVGMGLIPGAGGTASIPRRIGRHRAAYMALSGADIDLPTALAWGLVDAEAP